MLRSVLTAGAAAAGRGLPSGPLPLAAATATGLISRAAGLTHPDVSHAVRTFAAEAAAAMKDASASTWTPPPLETREWQHRSVRTGVLAVKAGMTQSWDQWGVRVPLTVLWLDNCQVTQVKSKERGDVTDAIQVGVGARRDKKGQGRAIKRAKHEFKVTPDAFLPVGHEIRASHFVAGQKVDVTGTTLGKGFQGAMKRWGFAGGDASHGNSLAHRALGSTGACQDPGRVEKGKKMPGRMGGKQRTTQNCIVYKVDPVRNLLYIQGAIPGHRGNFVAVKDAHMYQRGPARDPTSETRPFPTYVGEPLTEVQVREAGSDPFME